MTDLYSKSDITVLPWPRWNRASAEAWRREWSFEFEEPISAEQCSRITDFVAWDVTVTVSLTDDPRRLAVVQHTLEDPNRDDIFFASIYDLMRFANSLSRLRSILGVPAESWAPFRKRKG